MELGALAYTIYINSDRAVYSDLNPRDGGQSLYPMGTVYSSVPNKRHSSRKSSQLKGSLTVTIF